jgi:excisionase family DNA binding protein
MSEPMSEQTTFMSEPAVAQLLGVSRFTLLRARQRGEIGFYQFAGRVVYSPTHISEYLRKCERPAVAKAA